MEILLVNRAGKHGDSEASAPVFLLNGHIAVIFFADLYLRISQKDVFLNDRHDCR
ncbi:hypothetical protein C8J56DRAFT_1053097 [Mycena floridula]|nr:hypothetical protein C8J56DRAFT_1053097 [Mycena floridula]